MSQIKIVDKISRLLLDHHLSIGFAESVTGGMAMSMLTSIEGISKVFKGGIVCYHKDIKTHLLSVPPIS